MTVEAQSLGRGEQSSPELPPVTSGQGASSSPLAADAKKISITARLRPAEHRVVELPTEHDPGPSQEDQQSRERREATSRGFFRRHPLAALFGLVVMWMASGLGYLYWDYARHFEVWCAVVDLVLREFDAGILLIPHVQELSPKNDDRVLATDLVRHFNFDPRLQLAGGDYSASEFKGLISQCDMVVSSVPR